MAPTVFAGQIYDSFHLPYFAHENLDLERYPKALGMPTGVEPNPLGAKWGKPGDEDEDSDHEEEEDSFFFPEQSEDTGAKRRRSDIEKPTNHSFKRLKLTGGRPALPKKITADLDSDDEIIVRMKNAKYQEKDIAQKLIEEGRIAYNPKTIGTRWIRLKKAMQEKEDQLLDAALAEWHEGDDEALYEAVLKADATIAKAKEALDIKKWRLVADMVKNIKPVTNFSQNACETRFAALQAGTAKPTPESIINPDDKVKACIEARREKERRIAEDTEKNPAMAATNLEGNGWTSRQRAF